MSSRASSVSRIRYLTAKQLLFIHDRIIERSYGRHGIRDAKAVAATIELPKQRVSGKELYPTIFDKAAVYARNIITGHPFVDGNKRTGITAAVVFLSRNEYTPTAKPGEIRDAAVWIATDKPDLQKIAAWLKSHSYPIDTRV